MASRLFLADTDVGVFVGRTFDVGPFRPDARLMVFAAFRSVAEEGCEIDHSRIGRLVVAGKREPGRPFFAFLNYYDAHAPYVLLHAAAYRFGLAPRGLGDFIFLMEYWETIDKLKQCPVLRGLARDSYDNRIAYLDRALGNLFDELKRRVCLRSDAGRRLPRSWRRTG